mmetsp:Transcript_17868/g.33960  ORF Transcript_17868/g.33960 Transcript_17868/m.33960 type:complete len:83 (-) Transcript_17868:208-456(-)
MPTTTTRACTLPWCSSADPRQQEAVKAFLGKRKRQVMPRITEEATDVGGDQRNPKHQRRAENAGDCGMAQNAGPDDGCAENG